MLLAFSGTLERIKKVTLLPPAAKELGTEQGVTDSSPLAHLAESVLFAHTADAHFLNHTVRPHQIRLPITDKQRWTSRQFEQSLRRPRPKFSTSATRAASGHLRPREENTQAHTLTHVQTCIPSDSRWKEKSLPPSPLAVPRAPPPPPPRPLGARTDPTSAKATCATHKKPFL